MEKIGFFGGSFDPPHLGHIIPLIEAQKILNLKKIFFIPAWISPNKNRPSFTNKEIRIQMLQTIVNDFNFFDIEYFEINKQEISYSIDTVKYINKHYSQYDKYLIIGEDNFKSFDKWKDYKKITQLIKIAVLKRYTNSVINKDFDIDKNAFIMLKTSIIEISSSMVRDWIKNNLPYKYLVSSPVYNIIKEKKLYI